MLDEVGQPAGGLEEHLRRRVFPLIDQGDLDAPSEERELLQALGQHLPLELRLFEDVGVRPEGDDGPGLIAGLDLAQAGLGLAPFEGLLPHRTVPGNFHYEALGKGVDHGNAHAVKAAGHRVGLAVELPAGMQGGQDDLHRGAAVLRLRDRLDRDPAAVVHDPAPSIREQLDDDSGAEPSQCLIDGVVHDLVGEVVQAPRAGAPDVHPGPAAYCFQALQDGDISRRIARVGSSDRHVTSDVRRACSALSWGRDRSLKRDPNTSKLYHQICHRMSASGP